MTSRYYILVLLAALLCRTEARAAAPSAVQIQPSRGVVELQLDGKPVASYLYKDPNTLRPFFAHVKTLGGIQVTRNHPPIEGVDRADHGTMHPGVWLAFANLNGRSFWHNNDGRVIHERFEEMDIAAGALSFTESSRYVVDDDRTIAQQRARYRIATDPDGYVIHTDVTITAVDALEFGVKEEMGLGVRVATPLAVVTKAGGAILNNHGDRDEKGTWGKVAQWWDYHGVIDGRRVGVMIMSAPTNPPVWSHSRNYGLLVANPFPVDRKENRDLKTTIAPGDALRLRFGVLVHEHDPDPGVKFDRDAAYQRYVRTLD